ncbi:BREX-3 system P-loop-containing protein BrxF [Bacillus sp. S13(2024)]|uniref:BREX-3 system P-loop-containing protein BrxF n=1 Tax=unclassified Bacillus (in: firmicutes) TaxID=185979 RepID=UPI003D2443D7
MDLHTLNTDIQQMDNWWHKLIFVCDDTDFKELCRQLHGDINILNLNLVISEGLINVAKGKYPLYIEEILQDATHNSAKIYCLMHIDILFDPSLQTNPVRLLENLSKRRKLIVMWPGSYRSGKLIYAESGHPEYFVCEDFEGKVITG